MPKKDKIEKESNIVKHNHLVEACYHLTLTEQRLVMLMVSMIEPDDEDFKPYRIVITDFAKVLDIVDDSTYSRVKKVTKNLMEKTLQIETLVGLLQINWFSSVLYHNKNGYIELCFDPKLKPYLLHLKAQFTQYKLENIVRLESVYSIRIYELLIQYWRLGKRAFKVEQLRRILGIVENEYYEHKDFRKRVILTAQKELEKKTNISFTFEESKTGRRITDITMYITKQPEPTGAKTPRTDVHAPKTEPINVTPTKEPPTEPPASTQPEPPSDISTLVALLPSEHRGKKTITDAITSAYKAHGKEYVAYNIRYANANCKEKAKYRVYLNKALKENWAAGLAEDVEAANKQAAVKKTEAKKKEADVTHDKELYDRAVEYIVKLKAKERKKLEAEAMATLPPEQQEKVKAGNVYALKGLTHVMEGLVMERLAGQNVVG